MAGSATHSITTNSYWRFTVVLSEGSVNPTANTSPVTATVYLGRTGTASYIVNPNISYTVTVDGTAKSFTYTASGTVNVAKSDTAVKVGTLSWTITHGSNGAKTASWSASFSNNVSGVNPTSGSFSGQSITLTTIDRNAPTVTGSVAYQGSGAVKITATSSATANKWEYKIGSGAWTQYSTTSGTSATTGSLSPGSSSYTTYVRATRSYNGVAGTSSAFTIDLTAPTVSFTTSAITDSSVKVSATSNYACNSWDYSTNGGSSWTNFSTTSSTSATKTITGLSPATTYSIRVRARRTSNLVYGTAASKSITTLGGSVLTSVPDLAIDAGTTVTLSLTVYNKDYYHRLYIYNGGTSLGSVNLGKASATGSTTISANLSTLKTAILNTMTTVTSKSFTYRIQTFPSSSYSGQIGSNSDKAGTIKVTSANSGPTFSGGLTCTDTNATVTALTGGDAFIQSASSLKVEFTSATARNSATISSYATVVGSKSVAGNTPVSFGAIAVSGSSTTVTTTVTDSRGFTKAQSATINVLPYAVPSVTNLTIARINNYEEVASVALQGSYSPVTMNGTDLNEIQSITYHKRVIETPTPPWDADVDITSDVTINTGTHTFEWSTNTFENGNLVRTNQYEFEFTITDKLGSRVIARQIPDGTPVLSLRKAKVGINNPNPGAALEVGNNLIYADETRNSVGVNVIPVNDNSLEVGGDTFIRAGTPTSNTNLRFRTDADVPLASIQASRALHRLYFYELRNDTNYEQYRLPSPDLGTASNATYDILTTKQATAQQTTIANVVTASSSVTISAAQATAWGKVVTVRITFSPKAAFTVNATGGITQLTVGTLASAYRPLLHYYVWSGQTFVSSGGYSIGSNGTIYLTGMNGTGSSRTVATTTSLTVQGTFLIP